MGRLKDQPSLDRLTKGLTAQVSNIRSNIPACNVMEDRPVFNREVNQIPTGNMTDMIALKRLTYMLQWKD